MKSLLQALSICSLVLFFNTADAEEAGNHIVPDHDTYEAFLLNDWKRNAPTLIAFKDPACPYCIKDLKKRGQLQNYNVFLFWAPILGDYSRKRVDQFFECAEPVGDLVVEAVIERRAPDCETDIDAALRVLNDDMLARYDPTSVPQYWFGGRRVTLSTLKLRKLISAEDVANQSRLRLNWSRYTPLSVNQPAQDRLNVALVLPAAEAADPKIEKLLAKNRQYNWFLVDLKSPLGEEIRLLSGLESSSRPVFLLEGKPLTDVEATSLIPRSLRSLL